MQNTASSLEALVNRVDTTNTKDESVGGSIRVQDLSYIDLINLNGTFTSS
jgi:hypothetical protein